jgi:hypothetical protein
MPGNLVPLSKLASYIQQLRSFLPESTGRRGDINRVIEAKDQVHAEDFVTAFMDSALVTDWDKLSPKVSGVEKHHFHVPHTINCRKLSRRVWFKDVSHLPKLTCYRENLKTLVGNSEEW